MATMASTLLLRAAVTASSRASGVAAAAPRAARCSTRDDGSSKPHDDDAVCRTSSYAGYANLSDDCQTPTDIVIDDGKTPMEKNQESDEAVSPLYEPWCAIDDDGKTPMDKDMDEAVWLLYERWCKGLNKKRDHAEMACRFKLFKFLAKHVRTHNTYVPADPKKAAYVRRRRRQLLSKGEDVEHIPERYLPMELGHHADGSDPFLSEFDKSLLKDIEETEAHGAVK